MNTNICIFCGSKNLIDDPELANHFRCRDCKGRFKKPEVPTSKIVVPVPTIPTPLIPIEKEEIIPQKKEIEIIKKEPEVQIPSKIYPKVLILLPTKNHGNYLEKHLKLYQKLDYPPDRLRMVIVYSPSSDKTLELSMDFAKNSKFRVEIYEEPKFRNLRGKSSHWIGDLCNGMRELVNDEEFTLFIDDDITDFSPDFLKKMVELDLDVVAPYVYLEGIKEEFWDTMVFRDVRGRNFDRLNPIFKYYKGPVEVSSAGCCLLYKSEIFKKVPFGNPAPHLTWCNTARAMGYKIWALPFVSIIHADVRKERLPWDRKYAGRTFVEKTRKEKIETRSIIKEEYLCSYCGNELEMAPDKKSGYCPDCRQTLKEENIQERKTEQIISEWVMEPIKEYPKITRASFKPLYIPITDGSLSIFGFTGTGYGGLASVPFYLQNALNEEKIPNTLTSLLYEETEESLREKLKKASDYIFYLHYDKLGKVTPLFLREAKKMDKKVIVFPTDSWMDVNPDVRRSIYKDSWRVIAYADWIKKDAWDGECKSYGEDPRKILVQRFGVREGKILTPQEKKRFREELGLKTKFLVGEMGFVREGKGMIYPMLEVLSQIKDLSFLILGSTDPTNLSQTKFLNELVSAIARNHLEDRIIWVNRKVEENEIDQYLGACDFLVCPNNVPTDTSGSLNLTLGIDGGSCVVTTKQRTRREIEEKYKAIITADPEDFPTVIKELLDSGSHEKTKEKARKYVQDFSWREFGKSIFGIFQTESKAKSSREKIPKVLIATAIKFDTNWQRSCFERNLEELKKLDYPKEKLKLVYMCASDKEASFIKTELEDYEVVTLPDPEEWIQKLGDYRKYAVHFYAELFNNMRKEITDDIEFVLLLDADYVQFPPTLLKDLIGLNVDIVSPYLYGEKHENEFFDTYGFGRFIESDLYRPGYYQQFDPKPPFKNQDGIVQLAYAGTGIQLIKATIFKEIPWVNPDSWLHWCQMAREKGYFIWAAPYLKAYHGSGYKEAGKESGNIFALVESGHLSIDRCIENGLTTIPDWYRLIKIKWTYIQRYYPNIIFQKTIQKWIDQGKCRLGTIEATEELIEYR